MSEGVSLANFSRNFARRSATRADRSLVGIDLGVRPVAKGDDERVEARKPGQRHQPRAAYVENKGGDAEADRLRREKHTAAGQDAPAGDQGEAGDLERQHDQNGKDEKRQRESRRQRLYHALQGSLEGGKRQYGDDGRN